MNGEREGKINVLNTEFPVECDFPVRTSFVHVSEPPSAFSGCLTACLPGPQHFKFQDSGPHFSPFKLRVPFREVREATCVVACCESLKHCMARLPALIGTRSMEPK